MKELITKLDTIFSQYIRRKYMDEYGMVQCYTCQERKHWSLMQNGHFIPRANMCTRFHEDNCRPQCESCNCFKSGNLKVFEKKLEAELGEKKFSALSDLKYGIRKYAQHELLEMIIDYKQKVDSL